MARDLNNVVIVGRLTRDPEVKYTPNGQALARISIANNTSYTQNNELKEYVNYFDATVWGNQAVNCQKYLRKGSQVVIQGRLRQDRWEDKTTGKTVSKVEIQADSIQFLGSANGNGGQNNQYNNNQNGYQAPAQNMQSQQNFGGQPQMGNPYQNANQQQSRPNNNLNPWADDNVGGNDYYADTFNQGNQGNMPDGGYAGSDDDIPF